jgi:formylglycine-generating enzyme required for sulfatase activity
MLRQSARLADHPVRPCENTIMTSPAPEVFLSYSRNDLDAANRLRDVLAVAQLTVFKDDASLHAGDRWLTKLQEAVGGCSAFVVLVGRDGVRRWIGAEVEVALIRHLQPHDDKDRLPIFPILLGDATPESLPPFLALFQVTRWNGKEDLPEALTTALRDRQACFDSGPAFKGDLFLGLSAFTSKETRQFFGRRRETLEALAGLGDQTESNPEQRTNFGGNAYTRWLQIEGNSGSGKSSLLQAGILPMIERGALWARTGIEDWQILGPMMPGSNPVKMLADVLVRKLDDPARSPLTIEGLQQRFQDTQEGFANLLRERRSGDGAFLLVIDQFEELFTFADDAPRKAFDALLAKALQDKECPLFVISTVRADFLDRFDQLPSLATIPTSLCKRYFLPSISEQGLREVIDGPARLTGLDVSEVRAAILEDAREEMAGALPLVENALNILWKECEGNRLSGEKYRSKGKLAGMLASQADILLADIEAESGMAGCGRYGALELLLRLTCVNDDGRNTRQRISRQDAILTAGCGREDIGERIVRRLSGDRDQNASSMIHPGLRLIVVTIERDAADEPLKDAEKKLIGHVDLIHETLIRARGKNEKGKPVGYWPTLFDYIAKNASRGDDLRRLKKQALDWSNSRGLGRWWHLAGRADRSAYRLLAVRQSSVEARFLCWSRRAGRASMGLASLAVLGFAFWIDYGVSERWVFSHDLPGELIWLDMQWRLGISRPFPEMGDEIATVPVTFSMRCNPDRDEEKGINFKCKPEDAPHDVTLNKPYRLGRFEVTRREYLYFLRDAAALRSRRSECSKSVSPDYPKIEKLEDLDLPANIVSWCDANAYVEWLNVRHPNLAQPWRLPTEAEWEYAARGKAATAYWWGPEFAKGEVNCDRKEHGPWTVSQSRDRQQATPFGLYNMLGNVREWVEDAYRPYGETNQTDSVYSRVGFRVWRGGSWDDRPAGCRAAYRDGGGPDLRYYLIGFRVCRGSPIETRDAAALGAESPSR